MKKYTQFDLNKIFAAQSNKAEFLFKNRIWYNNNNKSLRLTLYGYNFVTNECKIKPHKFELQRPLTNKQLLQLERYFPSFYFLLSSQSVLYIFDEETLTLLILLGGDVEQLLNNYENSV